MLGRVVGRVAEVEVGAAWTHCAERSQRLVRRPAGGDGEEAPPSFHPVRRSSRRVVAISSLLELDVPVGPRGDELPARAPEERPDDRQHDGDAASSPEKMTIATLRWRATVEGLRSM